MMESELIHNILEDGFFAALAAVGFSSISHAPARTYLLSGLAAAIGHSIRYILMLPDLFGLGIILASTLSSLAVGFIAVLLAPSAKIPAETCLFPALLPMIPGMYAYRAFEGMIGCVSTTDQTLYSHYFYMFGFNGLTCIFIIFGMIIGANIPVFLLKRIAFRATRLD